MYILHILQDNISTSCLKIKVKRFCVISTNMGAVLKHFNVIYLIYFYFETKFFLIYKIFLKALGGYLDFKN